MDSPALRLGVFVVKTISRLWLYSLFLFERKGREPVAAILSAVADMVFGRLRDVFGKSAWAL